MAVAATTQCPSSSGSVGVKCGAKKCASEPTYEPTAVKYPTKLKPSEIVIENSVCLFSNIEEAIAACKSAQQQYIKLPISVRKDIIYNVRQTALKFAEDFALAAWSDTGRGRYEDKLVKQRLAAQATPGVEDLAPKTYTGDRGITIIDYAPYGVIGSVTPVTNPTATVINNTISIISGGNGVVFNPHPGGKACTNRAVAILNQAICRAGGPCCLIASVSEPTIESGQKMMSHPDISANLITGGPAVVKVALSSGKKSFCAGPGNPPVVVDETADVAKAAAGIYWGASFDNNMICSDEKQVFCVDSVVPELLKELEKQGAYRVKDEAELNRLMEVAFVERGADYGHGVVNKDLVGADASLILSQIDVKPKSGDCRLIVAQVGQGHPLVWTEQLMPILPIVPVKSFAEALELAYKSEYNYKHTSSIYSSNLNRITEMAAKMNTSIFVVNGSHTAGLASGGEGYTSFSIAGTTGEGMTRPSTFVRERRLVCVDALRYV